MRLISCKIENFGMLSNVEYTFDAPIHIISAENGAGKSTLAAFLKAMLYGLEGKGRSIEDNERKRYVPWQGGRFGGSLIFAAGGHTYRVERFFGKTPKSDTFALYDAKTNLVSNAFSSALGEELFGIDGEAFARTTFFTWQPVEKGEYNNSIHAKLNGLLDATDDIGDFDAAIDRLDAERKVYEKRGNTGRLSELEDALHDLSLALQKTVEAKALLSEKTAEYEACAKEKEEKEAALEALRRELKEQQRKEVQRGVAMQLLRYEKELASCDATMSAAKQTLGEVDASAEIFASALAEAKASHQTYTLALAKAEDHEKEITAAKASFDQTASLPDDTAFAKIAEAVTEYTALSAKEGVTADVTKAELQEAKQLLLEAETAHQAMRSAEDALHRAERSLPTKQIEKNSKTKAMALTIIGACLLLASVLGIVFLRTAPFPVIFLCTAIAAIVLLAFSIYSFIKVGRDAALAEAAYREYETARAEAEEKHRVCEAYAVRLRAAVVDLTSEETFQAVHSIEVLLTWARAEIAKAEVASMQAESKKKRLAVAKEAAETALNVYSQAKGDTPMARLSALREAIAQYKEDRKHLEELLQRARVNTAQAEAARAQVESFLTQFGYNTETETLSASLQAVESARRDYDAACARKSATLLERIQYLADEGITEKDVPRLLTEAISKPSEETAFDDMEAGLRKEIDACKTRLYQIGTEIEALDQVVGEASYLEAQEASLQKELAEAEHTRDLITLTKGFLENAKIELSTRYLRTMEAHFLRYFRLVAPMREEKIAIDANLSPKIEIGGTRQPVEAFSHGLRDLLHFCMRLALTESMYEESTEYPPLILDDPFVNLDEAKLEKAKLLLDTLAKRYQILYFTCHESRELK